MKWTSKPNYIEQKTFDKDLLAINKIETTVILAKPAYAGTCILEVIKVPMYGFHYN